eukprot:252584-Alexandrium_andersonii.AAC.1
MPVAAGVVAERFHMLRGRIAGRFRTSQGSGAIFTRCVGPGPFRTAQGSGAMPAMAGAVARLFHTLRYSGALPRVAW